MNPGYLEMNPCSELINPEARAQKNPEASYSRVRSLLFQTTF